MKIAIAGAAGRMGRTLLEAVLNDPELALGAALEQAGHAALGRDAGELVGAPCGVKVGSDAGEAGAACDVLIDFTRPEATLAHLQACLQAGKAMVIGTTGFSEAERQRIAEGAKRIAVAMSPNFSVGVNVFFHLLKLSAKSFERFPEYDVFVQEIHHKDKVDSPSGTALTAAEIIMHNIRRKKELLITPPAGTIKPEQLHVSSTRAGSVVGKHSVTFDSSADSIELTHTAKNRSGFAFGALLAADWIRGKQGIFTMEDVLADIVQ